MFERESIKHAFSSIRCTFEMHSLFSSFFFFSLIAEILFRIFADNCSLRIQPFLLARDVSPGGTSAPQRQQNSAAFSRAEEYIHHVYYPVYI